MSNCRTNKSIHHFKKYIGLTCLFFFGLIIQTLNGQKLVQTKQYSNTLYGVDIDPKGTRAFIAGKDSLARVVSLSGEELQVFNGHEHAISSIKYLPTQNTVLTGSYDNSAILWDMNGEILSRFIGHKNAVINIDATDKLVATASRDKTAKIWDHKGQLLLTLTGHYKQLNSIQFLEQKGWILTGGDDATVKIWSFKGELLTSSVRLDAGVRAIGVAPGEQHIYAGLRDGTISILDFQGNLEGTFDPHNEMVSEIIVLAHENLLISCAGDRKIVFSHLNGKFVRSIEAHQSYVAGIAHAGNMLLSASGDNSLKVWRLE